MIIEDNNKMCFDSSVADLCSKICVASVRFHSHVDFLGFLYEYILELHKLLIFIHIEYSLKFFVLTPWCLYARIDKIEIWPPDAD